MILNGIVGNNVESNFNNFRFVDLKATQGKSVSHKQEILEYLQDNKEEVSEYFVSQDETFGLPPHVVVLLGNSAYELFSKYVKQGVIDKNPQLRWVCMPHPSAQTVSNGLMSVA